MAVSKNLHIAILFQSKKLLTSFPLFIFKIPDITDSQKMNQKIQSDSKLKANYIFTYTYIKFHLLQKELTVL